MRMKKGEKGKKQPDDKPAHAGLVIQAMIQIVPISEKHYGAEVQIWREVPNGKQTYTADGS